MGRTYTFKIRIKAAQYQKALDPEMWPLRVGIRHYRQPRNKGPSWTEQANRAGGVINQQPPSYHRHPQYNQQPHRHPNYPQQFHSHHQLPNQYQPQQYAQPPQTQEHLVLEYRFVQDGFRTEVWN